jgi:purine-binding chemotaxis protein CheW
MSSPNQYVVFSLDEQPFALHLSAVERVIRAVEVTRLPNVPEAVLGVLNLQGQIIPAFNARKRFGLPEREMDLTDQLVVARARTRRVALVVDAVKGINESEEQEVIAADGILPDMGHIEGVVKLEGDLILIHDLDKFLSLDEEKALDAEIC